VRVCVYVCVNLYIVCIYSIERECDSRNKYIIIFLKPPMPGMATRSTGVRSVPVMPVPLQTELTGGRGAAATGASGYWVTLRCRPTSHGKWRFYRQQIGISWDLMRFDVI
jgi:hypothetical protein